MKNTIIENVSGSCIPAVFVTPIPRAAGRESVRNVEMPRDRLISQVTAEDRARGSPS